MRGRQCSPIGLSRHVGPSAIPQKFPAIILATESHGGNSKSTTTPAHKTTLYTIGLTKEFHSPHRKPPGKWPNTTADQPHERPPHHAPEPNGAKESHRRVSKPDSVVPNYSAFGIYWNPSLTHHPRNSLSNAPPNSETWQKQQGHPAHMNSWQIRRAPTKQCPMGVC